MPSRRQVDATYTVDMMAACRTETLSKVYGRRDTAVHALREVTLSIPSRAFSAIMGPSGSGKSTLLHCLAALDTPTSGRVFLGHTELTALNRRQQAQVRRDHIGFVFQAFNLVPTLDAIENITLPQLLAGRRPDKDWLDYVVTRIGLGDRLHHRPSQLSGGQQQRVALARALAGRPEVIFADEPTGNLDTNASREMLALLRSAVDDFHQTVVTVTHDPAFAGYADQVVFFTDGQVVDQILQPDSSLVLEHLQSLDSSAPAQVASRGQLHAATQTDGQHTMRNRRRRRADDSGPGRPMVGSDDEVEVARQERWLQRIREQFEAEQESMSVANDETSNGATSSAHTLRAGAPPHDPLSNERHPSSHLPYDQPEVSSHGAFAQPGHRDGYDLRHDDAADSPWLAPARGWLMGSPPQEAAVETPPPAQLAAVEAHVEAPQPHVEAPPAPHEQHDAWSYAASTVSVDVDEVDAWHTDDRAADTSTAKEWQTASPEAPARQRWADEPVPDDPWGQAMQPPPPSAHDDDARPPTHPVEHWNADPPPPPRPTTDAWQPWQSQPRAVSADAVDRPVTGHVNGFHAGDAASAPDADDSDGRHEHDDTWGSADDDPVWSSHDDATPTPEPELEPLDIWSPDTDSTWSPTMHDEPSRADTDHARHAVPPQPPPPASVPGSAPAAATPTADADGHDGFGDHAPATVNGHGAHLDTQRNDAWTQDRPQDEVSWTQHRPRADDAGAPVAPEDDDPYLPEPRHQQQFNDTLTDPFEALASLQLQLDRLGGGRRPPRRPKG